MTGADAARFSWVRIEQPVRQKHRDSGMSNAEANKKTEVFGLLNLDFIFCVLE